MKNFFKKIDYSAKEFIEFVNSVFGVIIDENDVRNSINALCDIDAYTYEEITGDDAENYDYYITNHDIIPEVLVCETLTIPFEVRFIIASISAAFHIDNNLRASNLVEKAFNMLARKSSHMSRFEKYAYYSDPCFRAAITSDYFGIEFDNAFERMIKLFGFYYNGRMDTSVPGYHEYNYVFMLTHLFEKLICYRRPDICIDINYSNDYVLKDGYFYDSSYYYDIVVDIEHGYRRCSQIVVDYDRIPVSGYESCNELRDKYAEFISRPRRSYAVMRASRGVNVYGYQEFKRFCRNSGIDI